MNQSPQLFKQLMVGSGLERVFEIGPIFRAEEHNTPRHLNEATSIDFESAFYDHTEAMDACEHVVQSAYEGVAENCQDQLEALGLEDEFAAPEGDFPRLTYEEALDESTRRANSTSNSSGATTCPLRASAHSVRTLVNTTSSPTGRPRSSRSTSRITTTTRLSRRAST